MTPIISHEIRLASRPAGRPSAENFSLAEVPVGSPDEGQVLVRNLFMSVDPYMRGRMNDTASYVAPFGLGRPLDGGAVGEVVESRAAAFRPGDAVLSNYGWREYFVAPGSALRPVSREFEPLSLYLGALGMPGMTAWAGWQRRCRQGLGVLAVRRAGRPALGHHVLASGEKVGPVASTRATGHRPVLLPPAGCRAPNLRPPAGGRPSRPRGRPERIGLTPGAALRRQQQRDGCADGDQRECGDRPSERVHAPPPMNSRSTVTPS